MNIFHGLLIMISIEKLLNSHLKIIQILELIEIKWLDFNNKMNKVENNILINVFKY